MEYRSSSSGRKELKLFSIESEYFKHLLKSHAYTWALSCIHVFNSRSSLRKSLFKTWVVDSISHARATAHDSSNGTRNRIRFGTFDKSTGVELAEVFSLTRKLAAPLRASFLMGHMVASLARSSSLFFRGRSFPVLPAAHKTTERN